MIRPISEERIIIGWREHVSLPEWGVERIRAKADTGARTSAIDVASLEHLPDGRVRFEIVVDRRHPQRRVVVVSDVTRRSAVRSSLGTRDDRPVVKTLLRLGGIEKEIELSLVSRRGMLCRMLLGRTALEPEFLVDAASRSRLKRAAPAGRKAR